MNYFLETSRLQFRSWQPNDQELIEALWNNPDINRHTYIYKSMSKEELKRRLETELMNEKRFGVQQWPVFHKYGNEFVGACGLKPYKLFEGIFEFGIYILPEYWKQGYGYEAGSAMLEHTFRSLNISSVFGGHSPQNQITSHLMKKLGFRFTHYEYYPPTDLNHMAYILHHDEFDIEYPGSVNDWHAA